METITSCITKYNPNITSDMDKIVATGEVQSIFLNCEKISINFAIKEPAAADRLVYIHLADFGWSDLDNWASLHDKLQKDANNNIAVGNTKLFE